VAALLPLKTLCVTKMYLDILNSMKAIYSNLRIRVINLTGRGFFKRPAQFPVMDMRPVIIGAFDIGFRFLMFATYCGIPLTRGYWI